MKSLEALNTIFNDLENASIDLARADLEEYKIIEKELKAFEILKTKRVQLDTLFSVFAYHKEKDNSVQLTLYNSCVGFVERKLTQCEYYLLKEVIL